MRLAPDVCRRGLELADHGVLGTLHPERGADLVPVCFAVVGDLVGIPVDTVKPKASRVLQRTRNLAGDPRGVLLVEGWDPVDWSRLWWVRAHLLAAPADPTTRETLADRLRARYPAYRSEDVAELIVARITALTGWAASPAAGVLAGTGPGGG